MPEISIIVPVYNVEKYIHRCVDSVLNQTVRDFELILVDDGSSDNCGTICDEYAAIDSRVRVIHKKNGGVSSARNAGLDIARGEYISFVDSDDWVESTYLELLQLENCDLSICSCYNCDSFGNRIEIFRQEFSRTEIVSSSNVAKWFDHGSLHSVWTSIFRRRIIDENGIRFDCKTSRGEDIIFMLSYVNYCNKVKFCKEALYNYVRYGKGTLTTSLNPTNFLSLAYLDCFLNNWFSSHNVDSELFSNPLIWTRAEAKKQLNVFLTTEAITCQERYYAFKVFFEALHFEGYSERLLVNESWKYRFLLNSHSCILLMIYSKVLRLLAES